MIGEWVNIAVRQLPQEAPGSFGALRSIAWSGSLLVAIGPSGLLTSRDGITWTAAGWDPWDMLIGVTWTGTELVAIDNPADREPGELLSLVYAMLEGLNEETELLRKSICFCA